MPECACAIDSLQGSAHRHKTVRAWEWERVWECSFIRSMSTRVSLPARVCDCWLEHCCTGIGKGAHKGVQLQERVLQEGVEYM